MRLEDPVVAAEADTYERVALEQWLQTHTTSPVTRQLLGHELDVQNVWIRGFTILWQKGALDQ